MTDMLKKAWRIWCRTMGNKISDDSCESDVAAVIRTFYWAVQLITCFFIVAGVIRHWEKPMPRIDITFTGYFQGLDVKQVTLVDGDKFKPIDVSNDTPEELVAKLKSGKYIFHFDEAWADGNSYDQKVEDFSFEVMHPDDEGQDDEPDTELMGMINRLERADLVALLESASIQCYDSESVEELRTALFTNIRDNTVPLDSLIEKL